MGSPERRDAAATVVAVAGLALAVLGFALGAQPALWLALAALVVSTAVAP